jgi:hypothetical protein
MAINFKGLLGVLLCISFSCFARADYSYPYYYSTNNDGATVVQYVVSPGIPHVPSSLGGMPVVAIGANAFANTQITGVTIPDTVTTIGTNAFRHCVNLGSVTLGTNLLNIQSMAFYQCAALTSFTFPNSTTNIGDSAFASSGLTNASLGVGTSAIGPGAFYGCAKLTTVTLPNGLCSIGPNAFGNCSLLQAIGIPNSVTNIGTNAFTSCMSLASITVDPLNAFYGSVEGVLIDRTRSALVLCPPNKSGAFSIPEGVANLDSGAFQYCVGITSVTMPNSVTNMGQNTFQNCSNLTTVVFSTNLSIIGYSGFIYCGNLVSAPIPDGVKEIGTLAFCGCSALSQAVIPDSVTSIDSYAFNGCGLTNLKIGNSVTNIGERAFLGCSSLATSVIVPRSVISIGDYGLAVLWRVPAFYFEGDTPMIAANTFWDDLNATVYYLPDTSGWTNAFGGLTAVLWNPQPQVNDGSFGFSGGQFGFNITGTPDIPIVVWACSDLSTGDWAPVQTCKVTNGKIYFSDTQSSESPARLYRIRWQ